MGFEPPGLICFRMQGSAEVAALARTHQALTSGFIAEKKRTRSVAGPFGV